MNRVSVVRLVLLAGAELGYSHFAGKLTPLNYVIAWCCAALGGLMLERVFGLFGWRDYR